MAKALSVIYHGKNGLRNEIMASGSEFKIKEIRDFVKQHVGITATELGLLRFMSSKTAVRYKIDDPELLAEIQHRFPNFYE